jgi:hypothetical protein
MTRDRLRHIIARLSDFRVIKEVPMGARRLECDSPQIGEAYNRLEALLDDISATMVININETGHQDWTDGHAEKVVLPRSDEKARITITITIDKEVKQATLLAGITADGNYLKRLIVLPRDAGCLILM